MALHTPQAANHIPEHCARLLPGRLWHDAWRCHLQVARTAKMMITQMGFSKKLGQVAWSGGGGPSFLGQSMGQPADCSGQTSDEIDSEVKELVNRAYRCAPHGRVVSADSMCPQGCRGISSSMNG